MTRRNELVAKEELAANFWHDTAVTDNALVQCIADIRRALGDDPRHPRFVKTVPRVGYRFIAPVEEVWPEHPPTEGSTNGLLSLAGAVDGGSGGHEPYAPGVPSSLGLNVPSNAITPGGGTAAALPRGIPRRVLLWFAGGGALALAALASVLLYLHPLTTDLAIQAVPGRKAVAVMYFDNLSGREDLSWLREGLADMLITDLAQSDGLAVLSRYQLETLLSRLNLKRKGAIRLEEALDVARRTRAEAVILGNYGVAADQIVINVELYTVSDGRLIDSERLELNQLSNVLGQMDLTARKMAARMGALSSGRSRASGLEKSMTSNVEAYQFYSTGVSKARAFQNTEAIALLEKATRLDPNFAMAYARIGYAYAVTGFQPNVGKPYLERAMQLSDRLGEKDQLYVRAWYAIANGDFHGAIGALREIIAAYPQEVEAYTRLGRLLYREDRPEEALATVQQGLAVQPEDGDLYNVMGSCFLGLHRYSDAIAAFRQYVELAPGEPNSHDSLGMSYQQAGKFVEAAAEYQQALTLDSRFDPAAIHLGDLRAQQGRYREAILEYQRYIRLAGGSRPRAVAFGDLAEVYRRQGDSAKAEKAAADELKLSSSAVWDSLLVALDHHDTARAATLQEQLFADEPYPERGVRAEMRTKVYYEGMLALLEGQQNRAIALFEEALKHLPPISGLDLHEDCLANAYLQLSHYDEAIAEYQRILTLNPQYPLAEYHLAQAYLGKGQKPQAKAAYAAFLEQWKDADPDGPAVIDAKKALEAL